MFVVDIDKTSGVNTVHREDCIHLTQDNSGNELGRIGKLGGFLEFPNVGEALRYLKKNRISGIIEHCPICKPTLKFNPAPMESLGVEMVPTGCDSMSLDSLVTEN